VTDVIIVTMNYKLVRYEMTLETLIMDIAQKEGECSVTRHIQSD